MSRNLIVMTGFDSVIHQERAKVEGDGQIESGHDNWVARDFASQSTGGVRS